MIWPKTTRLKDIFTYKSLTWTTWKNSWIQFRGQYSKNEFTVYDGLWIEREANLYKSTQARKDYPLNTNVPIKTIMMKVSTIHMNTLNGSINTNIKMYQHTQMGMINVSLHTNRYDKFINTNKCFDCINTNTLNLSIHLSTCNVSRKTCIKTFENFECINSWIICEYQYKFNNLEVSIHMNTINVSIHN